MFVYRRALAFGSKLVYSERALTRRIQTNTLQNVKSKSTSEDLENFALEPKFTKDEQERILCTLNTFDVDQLSRFKISRHRIKRLESWRNKKGPFQSLFDILDVEGVSVTVLEKLCDKILSDTEDASGKTANKSLKNIVTPSLTSSEIQDINTVVGLHLDPMGISWAKICREENTLCEWSFLGFSTLPRKVTSIDLFHMAVRVLNAIPTGDIYILEAPQNAQNQMQVTPTYTQHLQFSSMLITLINTSGRHNPSCAKITPENNVEYTNTIRYLRHNSPARLFKILVGNERVSSADIVEKLLVPIHSENHSLPCTPISVSEEQRNTYLNHNSASCQLLGQALLLTITFMDTCLYQNPKTIKMLTNTKKAKPANKSDLK